MKEIYKKLKELEKKWGIKTYNEILDYWATLDDKIRDLTKSRETWKRRYLELKDEIKH